MSVYYFKIPTKGEISVYTYADSFDEAKQNVQKGDWEYGEIEHLDYIVSNPEFLFEEPEEDYD